MGNILKYILLTYPLLDNLGNLHENMEIWGDYMKIWENV